MPELFVGDVEAGSASSGSGLAPNSTDLLLEPVMGVELQPSEDIVIGQLLAYRYADNKATLATRTNIGIQKVSEGNYNCISMNDYETNEITSTVTVVGK